MNGAGDVVVPAGFHCIALPYADDIREIADAQACPQPDLELIDKAIAICREFQLADYGPGMYDNPHLARFHATLKALALDQAEQDPVHDTLTAPEPTTSLPLFEDFIRSAYPNGVPELDHATPSKRSSATSVSDSAATGGRRSKSVPISSDSVDFARLHATDKLGTLTVAQLKGYLYQYGLPVSGKKADLIDRVSNHIALK